MPDYTAILFLNGQQTQIIEQRTTMTNARFIKSVTEAAKQDAPQMPWSRGKRRAAFISKRKAASQQRKSA